MKTKGHILLSIVLMACFNVNAQVGNLDSTFNFNGKVTTDFNGGDDGATSVLMVDSGKILVAGYSGIAGNNSFALSRYNADASLDTSFGGSGKVITDFAPGYDFASCVALQSDGKIVAAGMRWNVNKGNNALIRYNTDGSLDTTFGTGGKVTHSVGTSDAGINSIVIQPDGKIVAVGICTTLSTGRDYSVVRYNTDGTLDNSFGSGGIVTTDFLNSYDFSFTVCLQADGKILVGGSTGQDPIYDFGIVRYDTLGNVDVTYGTNGFVTTDFGKPDEWANAAVIQPDGKLIMTGFSGSPYKVAMARYNYDGSLDTNFNSTGKVLANLTTHDEINGVTLEQGGKIVVAGVGYNGSNQDFLIARYLANGSIDNTFGSTGYVTTDFGTNQDKARGVVVQADGKIVAAGVSNQNFALARYITVLSTGIIDFVTMNNNIFIYPNPVGQNATLTYTLKKDEQITIRLIDTQGRILKTIIENEARDAGTHQQQIAIEAELPGGIYFLDISNSLNHITVKIIK